MRRAVRLVLPTLTLSLLCLALSGCNMIGYAGQALRGDNIKIDVEAQYRGLENKSVAVIVAADEYTMFHYPGAQLGVARAVSARLADNMPSVAVTDPQEVVQFQKDNPFWVTARYSELVEQLGVDAVILIDLVEYRTREPGNAHVWTGLITGNVGLIEKDAESPDNFTFFSTVRAQFPEDQKVGVLNTDDATIQLGMHSIFSRDAAGLFYDHTVIKPAR
jgi:hypothetical protein